MLEKIREKINAKNELKKELKDNLILLYNSMDNEFMKETICNLMIDYDKKDTNTYAICLLLRDCVILNDDFFVNKLFSIINKMYFLDFNYYKSEKKLLIFTCALTSYLYYKVIVKNQELDEVLKESELLSRYWKITVDGYRGKYDGVHHNIDFMINLKNKMYDKGLDKDKEEDDVEYQNIEFCLVICEECMEYYLLKKFYDDKVPVYENIDAIYEENKNELLKNKYFKSKKKSEEIETLMKIIKY